MNKMGAQYIYFLLYFIFKNYSSLKKHEKQIVIHYYQRKRLEWCDLKQNEHWELEIHF